MLSEMSSQCELVNILILGESNSGKSTLINSLANLIEDISFSGAINSGVKISVPGSFYWLDEETLAERTITFSSIGGDEPQQHENENPTSKYCRNYLITYGKVKLRLMDTSHTDFDDDPMCVRKYVNHIINHISQNEHLHSIWILIRSNALRMTATLTSILNELFSRFHRNLLPNILFIMTHSRETNYHPGTGIVLIKNLFKNVLIDSGTALSVNEHNVFSVDNEIFRQLILITNKCIEKPEFTDLEEDWKTLKREFDRLLFSTCKLKAYRVADTLFIDRVNFLLHGLRDSMNTIKDEVKTKIDSIKQMRQKNPSKAAEEYLNLHYLKLEETTIKMAMKTLIRSLHSNALLHPKHKTLEYLTFLLSNTNGKLPQNIKNQTSLVEEPEKMIETLRADIALYEEVNKSKEETDCDISILSIEQLHKWAQQLCLLPIMGQRIQKQVETRDLPDWRHVKSNKKIRQ